MAAYLEKRKTILKENQCVEIPETRALEENFGVRRGSADKNLAVDGVKGRQRKSSFISKSFNDPKLLEVSKNRKAYLTIGFDI